MNKIQIIRKVKNLLKKHQIFIRIQFWSGNWKVRSDNLTCHHIFFFEHYLQYSIELKWNFERNRTLIELIRVQHVGLSRTFYSEFLIIFAFFCKKCGTIRSYRTDQLKIIHYLHLLNASYSVYFQGSVRKNFFLISTVVIKKSGQNCSNSVLISML